MLAGSMAAGRPKTLILEKVANDQANEQGNLEQVHRTYFLGQNASLKPYFGIVRPVSIFTVPSLLKRLD